MLGRFPTWIAGLALTGLVTAAGEARTKTHDDCFFAPDWQGWSAPGDGEVLLLRVGVREIYRVELAYRAHVRHYMDFVLVSEERESPWICHAMDLGLTLTDRTGYRQPLIARSLHKLTPEEIAAIPREDLP